MRALAALGLIILAAPAAAQFDQHTLDAVTARPPADLRLPDLPFRDQRGVATTLRSLAGDRPLVLLFADYTCRHICGPGLALTAAALHDSGLRADRDYRVAVIGLDAHDGIAAARSFAAGRVPADVAAAARLLVGTPGAVAAASRALGYRAAYDATSDQYAHDASVYVFAADGHLTAVLPELGLRPEPLRAALSGTLPSSALGDRIARLCYGLDAAHGRFGRPILRGLQMLAALMLAAGAVTLWRRRRI